MLYKIARFLQLAGLILMPIAMAGNVAERNGEPVLGTKAFLTLAAIGGLVFVAGWLLQQTSRPQ